MLRKSLPIAALALCLSATSALAAPHAQTRSAPLSTQHSALCTPSSSDTQLADEIIRRLRRLGFNMIHNRLARPVEIVGDYA